MENLNPDTVGLAMAMLTTMVIGSTELVKRLFDKDFRAAAIIGVSAVVGAFSGALLLPEIGLVQGLVLGLGASGLVTTVSRIGKAE